MMTVMLSLPKLPQLETLNRAMVSLGCKDLLHIESNQESDWKASWAEQRADFIRLFYQYATDNKGYHAGRSWQEWKAQQLE